MENLAHYTSLRVGGPAQKFVHATTEQELIDAVHSADKAGEPVLIIGGGSNVLIGDQGFNGTVIRVETKGNSYQFDACSGGMITVNSGENWDDFVQWIISKGFADLETLSGIPGTVGGAPIQNIGAYGHEVCEVIARVRTWDRKINGIKTFTNQDCEFGYRTSRFKREKDRYVVLDVTFQLRKGEMSLPIKYQELASYLGVQLGDRALVEDVRQAVLALRAAKGMVLSENDPDSWSAGSFFVNPILSADIAAKLPSDAPRWPQPDGRIKTSAAWLMEKSGVKKGEEHEGARVSTKHVLALVNSGSAKASDIAALAKTARAQVQKVFGITLEPEVHFVGLSLD
ncbi:MAG: UDP-N-acetylmuramate dehydrogenase [Actinobacteria bacterium]|nr:UDP-N-acetylmuramate dehydrogenase [Actinomycetota bacterium]